MGSALVITMPMIRPAADLPRTRVRVLAWAASVCAMGWCMPAMARGGVPQPSLDILTTLIKPLFDGLNQYATSFKPMGETFLSVAIVLELFSIMLQYLAKGGVQDLMGKLFALLTVSAVPLALIHSWPEAPNLLLQWLKTDVPQALHMAHGAGSVGDAIKSVTQAVSKVGLPPGSGWVSDIVVAIENALVQMLLFWPTVLLELAILFSLEGPMVMLYIGIIFGPILIAWMPWQPASNLGMSWFRYMISLCFAYAIGLVLAMVMSSVAVKLGTSISQETGGAWAHGMIFVVLVPIVLIMLLMTYFMLKVESIAGAMVGGPALGHGGGMFFAGAAAAKALSGPKGGGKGGNNGAGGGGSGAAGAGAGGSAASSAGSSSASLSSGAAGASGGGGTGGGAPGGGGGGGGGGIPGGASKLSSGASTASGGSGPSSTGWSASPGGIMVPRGVAGSAASEGSSSSMADSAGSSGSAGSPASSAGGRLRSAAKTAGSSIGRAATSQPGRMAGVALASVAAGPAAGLAVAAASFGPGKHVVKGAAKAATSAGSALKSYVSGGGRGADAKDGGGEGSSVIRTGDSISSAKRDRTDQA